MTIEIQRYRVKDVFYCFSCINECDPDKHVGMERFNTGHLNFHCQFETAFRPRMILARGNLVGVRLKSLQVGNVEQLAIRNVPMRLFESPFDFPTLARMIQSGFQPDSVTTSLLFSTIPLGVPLTFELSDHITDFGLLGSVLVE